MYKLTKEEYIGTEEFFNRAVNYIHSNEKEFDFPVDAIRKYIKNNAVKLLKRKTGGCLVDCKDICVLYWAGKILNSKENRLQKIKKIENVL